MTVETVETIELNFDNREQLKQAYLPFLINGGIMIPTSQDAKLGDMFQLNVSLLDSKSRCECQG